MAYSRICQNYLLHKVNHGRAVFAAKRTLHQSSDAKTQLNTGVQYDVLSADGKLNLNEISHNKTSQKLDFDNCNDAYQSMTKYQLARSIAILRLCSNNFLVDRSLKMMDVGRTILGDKMFNKLMKATVYGQFVGGESLEEMKETADNLKKGGIGPLLAVCIEEDVTDALKNDDEKYDKSLEITLGCMNTVASLGDSNPMAQIKLTALVPSQLCQKLSEMYPEPSQEGHIIEHVATLLSTNNKCEIPGLTETETTKLSHGLRRLKAICNTSIEKNIIVMVDAEYTYMNPALNLFSLAMMMNCNGDKPLVYYTYQNYLKATHERLLRDISFIRGQGIGFATKLVRGAYMDKERHMARTQGYPDPMNANYDETTALYNRSMQTMLESIATDPNKFGAIIASHNEDTVKLAVERIHSLGIDISCGSIFFGQVYGMADHISFTLGKNNFPIYKSIPFGSVEECLPYLSRRAMENRSVLKRADKERNLMRKALKARRATS